MNGSSRSNNRAVTFNRSMLNGSRGPEVNQKEDKRETIRNESEEETIGWKWSGMKQQMMKE
jgi:hypothetical protein